MATEDITKDPAFKAYMSKIGKKGGTGCSERKRLALQQNAVKARQARWAGRRGQTTNE